MPNRRDDYYYFDIKNAEEILTQNGLFETAFVVDSYRIIKEYIDPTEHTIWNFVNDCNKEQQERAKKEDPYYYQEPCLTQSLEDFKWATNALLIKIEQTLPLLPGIRERLMASGNKSLALDADKYISWMERARQAIIEFKRGKSC